VSPLDRSYWREHWWQARRVLSVSNDSTNPPTSSPTRVQSKDDSEDVGW
jgi:hypothetical protein